MLKDSVRTSTYMKAIVNNKHLFKDKVVLDVGCGTGILCMFAAKAGAKKVIGIEMAGIINQAREIVKDNGFEDGGAQLSRFFPRLIQLSLWSRARSRRLNFPWTKSTSSFRSGWATSCCMNPCSTPSSSHATNGSSKMASSCLTAPPSSCAALKRNIVTTRSIVGFCLQRRSLNIQSDWDSVYGFKMSCIKKLALVEPLVDMCEARQVISSPSRVLDIDIYTVKKEDLDFKAGVINVLNLN